MSTKTGAARIRSAACRAVGCRLDGVVAQAVEVDAVFSLAGATVDESGGGTPFPERVTPRARAERPQQIDDRGAA